MRKFELVLFSTDPLCVTAASRAGIDTFIVDWEWIGKESRQNGADTQVNHDTLEDLVRVRAATGGRVLCRINGFHEGTPAEVEAAIAGGADEIVLPMVRGADEVDAVLDLAGARCGVGILVETEGAVRCAAELARRPLSRVYVGLNDLAIDRGEPNIFVAIADGTVAEVRAHFTGTRFGFGGLTLPHLGHPIPCRLLIGEMARLAVDFSFLRRSFHRDAPRCGLDEAVARIDVGFAAAEARSAAEIERDRLDLCTAVASFPATAGAGSR